MRWCSVVGGVIKVDRRKGDTAMRVTRHACAIELAFASFFVASVSLIGATPVPAAAHVDGVIAPLSLNDFVPTLPWSAEYTEKLQHFTSDNVVPDEVRPSNPSWELTLSHFFGASLPGSITVATPLNTANWFVSPAVTPTTDAGVTTYRWENPSGFGALNAFLSSLGRTPNPADRFSTPSSLGASIARESVGGNRIDAGATLSRSYVITAVGSSDVTVDISVFLDRVFGGPVSPSNQQCEGARVLGGGSGGFAWTVNLRQGTPVSLRCSATLTNTATTPAYYMPIVSATRTEQTSTAPDNSRVQYAFTSALLGSVAFDVTPGAGVIWEGHLTKTSIRTVFMNPLNQALVPTQLTYLGATSGYYGEGVTFSARLNHHGAFPVVQRPVRFDVDSVSYTATTGADGIATVSIPAGLDTVGPHLVTISSADDLFFLGTSLTATFIVVRRPTTTTFTGTTTAIYGEARLAGALVDSRTGAGLAGQSLSFSIDGAAVGSAVTNDGGAAELSAASDRLGVGTHEVTVAFAQTATHEASTATSQVTITGRQTLTIYTGDRTAAFGFATLAGRLTDDQSGAPLAGRTLTFTIDGVSVGAASTDASGTATIAPGLAALTPGGHDVGVVFAGDASHAASAASGRIVFTNSRGKVTGDVETADGAHVTFSVQSDGTSTSGTLRLARSTQKTTVSIMALGISTDRTRAVAYGETASGDRIVAEFADLGEPGRADRLIVSMNGVTLTGDGALIEGNLQIHD